MNEKITVTLKSVKKEGVNEKTGRSYKVYSYTLADGRQAEGFADIPLNTEVEAEMQEDTRYGWKITKLLTGQKPITLTVPVNNRATAVDISAKLIIGRAEFSHKDLFPLADRILEWIEKTGESK